MPTPENSARDSNWPPADEAIRRAMVAAFADGSWGHYHGRHGEALAAAIAARFTPEAMRVWLCSSGTVAVELALRGLRIGADDEVILAGYDFGGNFRAIEDVGAQPVLVDISPDTWCLDARLVEAAIGPRTKAMLVSHLHGGLADMPALREIADRRGLAIVEDACQAQGGIVAGREAGSWGDVGVWSFGGTKLLTAGRGGAIFTRREDVWQRIKTWCERGNNTVPLSELQSAVLLPQLDQLDASNKLRRENVARLLAATAALPGECLAPLKPNQQLGEASYYKLAFLLGDAMLASPGRNAWACQLQSLGVPMDAGFRGFAKRPTSRCRVVGELAHSRRAGEATLVLHHPVLLESAEKMERLAESMLATSRKFFLQI